MVIHCSGGTKAIKRRHFACGKQLAEMVVSPRMDWGSLQLFWSAEEPKEEAAAAEAEVAAVTSASSAAAS